MGFFDAIRKGVENASQRRRRKKKAKAKARWTPQKLAQWLTFWKDGQPYKIGENRFYEQEFIDYRKGQGNPAFGIDRPGNASQAQEKSLAAKILGSNDSENEEDGTDSDGGITSMLTVRNVLIGLLGVATLGLVIYFIKRKKR